MTRGVKMAKWCSRQSRDKKLRKMCPTLNVTKPLSSTPMWLSSAFKLNLSQKNIWRIDYAGLKRLNNPIMMKSLTFLFFMKLYQKTSSEEDEVVGHNYLGVSTDRGDLSAEISLRRGLCQHLIYQDIIISNHHYHHYSKHCLEGDREISVVLWGRALWTSAQRQQVGVLPTYLPTYLPT